MFVVPARGSDSQTAPEAAPDSVSGSLIMKFSSSLEFNAVPEWRSSYIDYAALKKMIYALEKEAAGRHGVEESLLARDPRPVFCKALNKEARKIDQFYRDTEAAVLDQCQDLTQDLNKYETAAPTPSMPAESDSESDGGNGEQNLLRSSRQDLRSSALAVNDERSVRKIALKREAIAVYVSLSELVSFIDLNRTGFRKILKKFDKIMGTELLPIYTNELQSYSVFAPSTEANLKARLEVLIGEYAALQQVDANDAQDALRGYLREHVVWERNTVWRDMISLERQKHAVVRGPDSNAQDSSPITFCGLPVPEILSKNANGVKVILFAAVFLSILNFPILHKTPQNNCLAIIVFASLLWATEALPLFVTSLMVPLLVVVLRVPLNARGKRMPATDAADFVFAKMWSPVIMVLLGGFALAAALSKYNIAKKLATIILARSGSNPNVIVLVLMLVSCFLCMWISNVAAPVLLFSVAQPLLRTLPEGDQFAKAIILGIALASNIGGMASPIASPQNIIALQNMHPQPSWLGWFAVAIPVCLVSIVLVWVLLIVTFPPTQAKSSLGQIRGTSDKFTFIHYYVIAVTIFTIVLWCFNSQLEPTAGNMGILALAPILLLFGPGVLSAADFNNFLWTIVALAMGGVALGKAVESCGLLKTAATAIQAQVQDLGLFGVCLVFGIMILVVASFVSHTVAALIVLPLVRSIGEQMEDPHPNVVVFVSALMCSAAMALPTSGFPNVAAICQANEFGTPYLTAGDFVSRGVPASILCYAVIVLLGYMILRLGDF